MTTSALPRGETIDVFVKDQGVNFATFATGNFTKTYIYSHSIEEKESLDDDPLLGQARSNDRDDTAPADGLPTCGGNLIVPIDFNHFGLWLKALLGAATVTGAGDPYTHVFTSGGDALPERSIEVAVKNVDAATAYMQYTGLVASKMQIEIAKAAGYQRATFDVMGRSEHKAGSSGAGTPAAAWARDPALASSGVFKIEGDIAADIMKVSASYDNKPSPQNHVTGSPYVAGFDLTDTTSFRGSIDLRFRTADLYDYAIAKTELATEILFAKSSSRSLSFAMPATRLERVGVPISGPGGIQQTFNFRCHQSADDPMLTATLKSLVPSY